MDPSKDRLPIEINIEPRADAVRVQLERVLSAPEFVASKKMAAFLRFVVEETLEGRSDRIKQYTIATKVFERDRDFDQQNDPIVRVQAAKVRRSLQRFYFEEGRSDPVRIAIPKGTYVPTFTRQETLTSTETRESGQSTGPPAVAVAPFANHSGDPAKDYLAIGFAEDLSTELSRFPGVSVVAYNASEQCGMCDRNVCKLGRELNVDFLICGSLRRADSSLRMNVQLFSTKAGTQVWAERFHRQFTATDLFEVQDDILYCILARTAGAFGVIHQEMAKATRRKENASLSGYEAVLRALAYARSTMTDEITSVIDALECAVDADARFAPAWAYLGICYLDSVAFGLDVSDNAMTRGIECAERALALNPNSQDAHFAMAWACLLRGDSPGVVRSARRMVELNPGDAFMLGTGGWFLALAGQRKDGMEIIERSRRLNPNNPGWFHFVAYLDYFDKGEYEAALLEARSLRAPGLFWDPLLQVAALGQLGRAEEASDSLAALLRLRPDIAEQSAFYVGCLVRSDELKHRIIEGLHAAGLDAQVAVS